MKASDKTTKNKKKYIFTNKTISKKSIMSAVLGILGVVSIVVAIVFTYNREGAATLEYGNVILLALIYGIIGEILGVVARKEPDRFYFFAYLGIVFNALIIIMVSIILYAGAYGI